MYDAVQLVNEQLTNVNVAEFRVRKIAPPTELLVHSVNIARVKVIEAVGSSLVVDDLSQSEVTDVVHVADVIRRRIDGGSLDGGLRFRVQRTNVELKLSKDERVFTVGPVIRCP